MGNLCSTSRANHVLYTSDDDSETSSLTCQHGHPVQRRRRQQHHQRHHNRRTVKQQKRINGSDSEDDSDDKVSGSLDLSSLNSNAPTLPPPQPQPRTSGSQMVERNHQNLGQGKQQQYNHHQHHQPALPSTLQSNKKYQDRNCGGYFDDRPKYKGRKKVLLEPQKRRFEMYRENLSLIPQEMMCYADERVFVIKDKYPKSIHHYLILPRQEVENLMVLRSDRGGLELIKEMERQGNLLIQRLKEGTPYLDFVMGFHIYPTMTQLHMHVMSTDFTSHVPYKAKCYKDFTTRLFLRVEELKRHLDKEGKFRLSKQTMNEIHQDNNAPMICLQCQSSLPTVQIRNAHMQQHLQQRKIEWESSVAVV